MFKTIRIMTDGKIYMTQHRRHWWKRWKSLRERTQLSNAQRDYDLCKKARIEEKKWRRYRGVPWLDSHHLPPPPPVKRSVEDLTQSALAESKYVNGPEQRASLK